MFVFSCFSSGTREEKTKKVDDVPWYETLWSKIKYIFTCCRPEPAPQPQNNDRVDGRVAESPPSTSAEVSTANSQVFIQ